MDKTVKKICEYITKDSDKNLISKLLKTFNIDTKMANDVVRYLDFGDYLELNKALDDGDIERAKAIIGRDMSESANSYSSTSSSSTTSTQQQINTGDKVKFTGDDGKEVEAKVVDNDAEGVKVQANNREKIIPKDQLSVEEEISRLSKLAGITNEAPQATATGAVTSTTPSAINSGAMSGVCMSKNKLKKLTRTKKQMKPGPKTDK